MERAVAHLIKVHAEQYVGGALDPNQDNQHRHEERTNDSCAMSAPRTP